MFGFCGLWVLFVNSVGIVNSLTLNLILCVTIVLWYCFVLVGLCIMVVFRFAIVVVCASLACVPWLRFASCGLIKLFCDLL